MRPHVLLTLAGFALTATCGCDTTEPARSQISPLIEGESAYRAGNYSAAVQRLSQFMAQAHDRAAAARGLYVRGMCLALTGNRPQAYSDLATATQQGDGSVAWRASATLGILHFEDEHWDVAATALTRATAKMPSGPPADALYYRLGLCLERTGRWAEALQTYERLLASAPSAGYRDHAGRRLTLRADHFAVQCGVFSQPGSADRLVADLRQVGLAANVRRESRGQEQYYVVLVGRYGTYAAAKQALANVRSRIPQAILWP